MRRLKMGKNEPVYDNNSEPSAYSAVHDPLTGKVIRAAHKILYELKPGLEEKLYERALVIELQSMGLAVESQREFRVHYAGHHIGTLIPDLIVEGAIIVDTKVVSGFNDSHLAQMLGYLNITGLQTALLLNFKFSKLQIKRIANSFNKPRNAKTVEE